MIKKGRIGLFVASLLSVGLVNAAGPDYYVEKLMEWIQSSYGPLLAALLNTSYTDEFLFAKALVFFLIFAVVFMVLKRSDLFGSNRMVVFVVTLIVSILSVRFMGDNDFIQGLLLPYGVLGASIIVFLPLLIYFLFVQQSVPGTFGRRAAWAAYGIIFLVMWGMRETSSSGVDYIYFAGFIFVILNFIFDGPIHEYFGTKSLRKGRANYHLEQKGKILAKLEELEKTRQYYSKSEYDNLKKSLETRLTHHVKNS